MNSKHIAMILLLCVICVFSVFSDSPSAGFGIVWNYTNGSSFVPATTIEVMNENEVAYETVDDNGINRVRDDIELSVTDDEQFAFIVRYTTNVSGLHTISYRVSPMYNQTANQYHGYTLRYALNNGSPSISAGGTLAVGSNGNLTYPINSSDFNTSFVLPTVSDAVSLYIQFFVTLNTEELPAGQNRSNIVIIEEAV